MIPVIFFILAPWLMEYWFHDIMDPWEPLRQSSLWLFLASTGLAGFEIAYNLAKKEAAFSGMYFFVVYYFVLVKASGG